MNRRTLIALSLAACVSACAREEYADWPAPPSSYAYYHPQYANPDRWARNPQGVPIQRPGVSGERSLFIPGGAVCLEWLRRHQVQFRVLDAKRGMTTPVEIRGPIGGVTYLSPDNEPLVCDCRLAVALHWTAPHLKAFGITEVQHAGAYVYRTTRKGRLSLHALGLAIDVRDLRGQGRLWSVEKNYYTGLRNGCSPTSPELNRIACRLESLDLFKELLTPDYNYDHHDHFHLAIAPPG